MAPLAKQIATEIDDASRWWNSYPRQGYSAKARPYSTYQSYIGNVYAPVQRLWKSASAERLSSWARYTDPETVKRTSSVSSLSPSHLQPLEDRVATRYVPLIRSYKPKGAQWREEYNFTTKHQPRLYSTPMYLPIYKYDTSDIYKNRKHDSPSKVTCPTRNITRWEHAFNYESSKLRGLDKEAPFMYTNYDLLDDRHYMHTRFQCRSFETPYDLRRYMQTFYAYSPRRLLVNY